MKDTFEYSKYTPEHFINLKFSKLTKYKSKKYPDTDFYINEDGEFVLAIHTNIYHKENSILVNLEFWKLFALKYSMNYSQIQKIIQLASVNILKLPSVLPDWIDINSTCDIKYDGTAGFIIDYIEKEYKLNKSNLNLFIPNTTEYKLEKFIPLKVC